MPEAVHRAVGCNVLANRPLAMHEAVSHFPQRQQQQHQAAIETAANKHTWNIYSTCNIFASQLKDLTPAMVQGKQQQGRPRQRCGTANMCNGQKGWMNTETIGNNLWLVPMSTIHFTSKEGKILAQQQHNIINNITFGLIIKIILIKHGGRPPSWHMTVMNMVANSYVYTASHTAGAVAKLVASHKSSEYAGLPSVSLAHHTADA